MLGPNRILDHAVSDSGLDEFYCHYLSRLEENYYSGAGYTAKVQLNKRVDNLDQRVQYELSLYPHQGKLGCVAVLIGVTEWYSLQKSDEGIDVAAIEALTGYGQIDAEGTVFDCGEYSSHTSAYKSVADCAPEDDKGTDLTNEAQMEDEEDYEDEDDLLGYLVRERSFEFIRDDQENATSVNAWQTYWLEDPDQDPVPSTEEEVHPSERSLWEFAPSPRFNVHDLNPFGANFHPELLQDLGDLDYELFRRDQISTYELDLVREALRELRL